MSDSMDEAEGVGEADPITGVTGAKGDLAADAQLPDADDDGTDLESLSGEADTLLANDAVAGETVLPGPGDGNDGPTGGSPGEATPYEPGNELTGQDIDLDDER